MKLDFSTGLASGLGDLCMATWFPNVTIHPGGDQCKKDICDIFGVKRSNSKANAKTMLQPFAHDYAMMSIHPRMQSWMEMLEIKDAQRPPVHIRQSALDWAEKYQDSVLIFPACRNITRKWNDDNWQDLYQMFESVNAHPIIVIPKRHEMYDTFTCLHGLDMHKVSALISNSKLVCCNDSCPAHLAGNLKTQCYVALGPTPVLLFDHVKDYITGITAPNSCAGCCYKLPNYHADCNDSGCQTLSDLKPDYFMAEIIKDMEAKHV